MLQDKLKTKKMKWYHWLNPFKIIELIILNELNNRLK